MSKNIVSILAILVLTACGGGGGSDPIVESSYTPPPTPTPTYTPPNWDGIVFYETDPNSDQWIDATYRRLTQDEKITSTLKVTIIILKELIMVCFIISIAVT